MIRAAVGLSTEPSAVRAALEAACQARAALDGEAADWCAAFVSAEHRAHVDALARTLSGALDTPYVAGCSASGVLVPPREVEDGPVVGILAVKSDQLRATPFLVRDDRERGLAAGIRLGDRLAGSRGSDDLLLAWPDPFAVRPDHLLRSIEAVLGPVPVVGGAASAGAGPTFQFAGVEVARSAVSGFRLGGRFRHVVGVTQGCRPLGGPLRVTRAHENLLLEIEGRPALDVLREAAPAGALEDLERGMHFLCVALLADGAPAEDPLVGGTRVRNLVAADPDTGVVALADGIEEGQRLVVVQREAGAAREDLRRLLERLSPPGRGAGYRFGLYFDCLARGRALYGDEEGDGAGLARGLPDVPILGFFGNAEVAPDRGSNRPFTYSGVLLLVGE